MSTVCPIMIDDRRMCGQIVTSGKFCSSHQITVAKWIEAGNLINKHHIKCTSTPQL